MKRKSASNYCVKYGQFFVVIVNFDLYIKYLLKSFMHSVCDCDETLSLLVWVDVKFLSTETG